jgi:hypothetical protein
VELWNGAKGNRKIPCIPHCIPPNLCYHTPGSFIPVFVRNRKKHYENHNLWNSRISCYMSFESITSRRKHYVSSNTLCVPSARNCTRGRCMNRVPSDEYGYSQRGRNSKNYYSLYSLSPRSHAVTSPFSSYLHQGNSYGITWSGRSRDWTKRST